MWQFGRYPIGIYRQPVRFVLTYVVPVAFIATYPAFVLTNGVDVRVLLVSLVVSVVAVALTQTVWNRGLRRYTSATS